MSLLGDPQDEYPVVHIAGTKGKGSTAVFIASVLQQAGYKVGLYTSPHLHDYVERIQINRVSMSHAELIDEVERLKIVLPGVPEITTFEITTAIAFRYFAEQKVDIAVIEVGLGGRLDATNIVNPVLSVITSLSYDHMNILGGTIEKIAVEKAGIIKPGVPVVVAPQAYPQTYPILKTIAQERRSPYYQVTETLEFRSVKHSLAGQEFEIRKHTLKDESILLSIRLLGFHQVENAVTAWSALEQLKTLGYSISKTALNNGFAGANWPCRFEVIHLNPMVVIDSAHNADSAEKLSATIKDYLMGQKITLIFGASEDKDIQGMFRSLLGVSDDIIMTKSVHPRAMEPEKLKIIAEECGRESIAMDEIEKAIDLAIQSNKSNVIVVTGSIFVAAAAKEIIQKRNQD